MVRLKYYCKTNDDTSIEFSAKENNFIYMEVNQDSEILANLILDKQTAIKFSKELRKQIALLD